jgi:hypothetical protein
LRQAGTEDVPARLPLPATPKSRRWLARGLVLAALATVLVILARWWLVDLARVASPSMAPLLMGSPASGDDVLFLKGPLARGPWDRYDLAVFLATEEGVSHPVPTIKRIGGLPHEEIQLRHGDLYVKKKDGMTIDRKPHRRFDELLIPVAELDARSGRSAGFRWDEQRSALQPAGLSLDGARELAHFRYGWPDRPDHLDQVTDGYLDQDGVFHDSHLPAIAVSDLRFQIDLTVDDDAGRVEILLRDGGDVYGLSLAGAHGRGPTQIAKNGVPMADQPPGITFERGHTYHIDFYNIDTEVGFYLDGTALCVNGDPEESRVEGRERNAPELNVEGMRVTITRARVSRDLYWISEGPHATSEPLSLKDQYFMLGDNSAESIDSRVKGPIPSGDLIGRPIAIVDPWRRRRRL